MRISIPVFIASLAVASLCTARDTPCPAVTPGNAIEYGSGQLLDANAPAGVVHAFAIILHGLSGNRGTHINQIQMVLEDAGWAWFAIDYRNAADIRTAVKFIQCPGRFNVAGKPVLIGEDTGAALALSVATSGYASIVGFGTDASTSLKEPPIPVLMFHGEADHEFPIALARTACESWKKCTFVPVPKAIHNLENWHPDQWEWKEDLTAWLRGDKRGPWPDIVYSRPGGQPLHMDAFLSSNALPGPAVIVVHGGGWEAGDRGTYISPLLHALTHSNFTYFSIDYRLTPYVSNAEQLEDLRAAIRYIRSHAARFHVDPNRISLAGESAGGQLVTQVASLPCPDCSVAGVVSLYGVYDFTQFTKQAEGKQMLDRMFGNWTLAQLQAASPVNFISNSLPPLLLVQGTKDELYPGTLSYAEALKRAGKKYELIVVEGAPHGMENWVNHPEWLTETFPRIVAWLRGNPASP